MNEFSLLVGTTSKEVYLCDQVAWLIAPLLTFDGVTSLLKHCRELSSLGVFFNATLAVTS
jgi:hypothetical protein